MTHIIQVFHQEISKHMVRYMQFVHLSCIKISTISKQTKLSFHLSTFTQEYHRVHPKWFLSLRCIRRKSCTYLAPKLTMSPNRLKRDFIWQSSRSSIGRVQMDFLAYGTFLTNRAPILHQDQHYLQTDRTKLPLEPSPRSNIVCFQQFLSLWCIMRKLCTNLAPKLTVSKQTEVRFNMTHIIQEFYRVCPN